MLKIEISMNKFEIHNRQLHLLYLFKHIATLYAQTYQFVFIRFIVG
jgi:hypothetical protein